MTLRNNKDTVNGTRLVEWPFGKIKCNWISTSASDGEEPTCDAGNPDSIPESGRSPGERNGYPTPVFLPRKSHGWRSLVGYSPWGHKELDTTK